MALVDLSLTPTFFDADSSLFGFPHQYAAVASIACCGRFFPSPFLFPRMRADISAHNSGESFLPLFLAPLARFHSSVCLRPLGPSPPVV